MTARTLLIFMVVLPALSACGGEDRKTAGSPPSSVAADTSDQRSARSPEGPSDDPLGDAEADPVVAERRARLRLAKKLKREERRGRKRAAQRLRKELTETERRAKRKLDARLQAERKARRDRNRRFGSPGTGTEGGRSVARADDPVAQWRFDRDEARKAGNTIRAYIDALDRHDGSVCDNWVTMRFVHKMTGRQGTEALERCRKQISGSKLPARLLRFGAGRVRPGEALIEYTASVGTSARTVVAHLLKVGDRYRIDGDGSAEAQRIREAERKD